MVRFEMLAEMVAAHESLGANSALEPLFAGVRAHMTLKFVGTSEPLAAEQPVAEEWPLTCMPAQVSLQVRRLVVDLSTSGQVTGVDIAFAYVQRSGRTQSVRLLTVRAVARAAPGVPAM